MCRQTEPPPLLVQAAYRRGTELFSDSESETPPEATDDESEEVPSSSEEEFYDVIQQNDGSGSGNTVVVRRSRGLIPRNNDSDSDVFEYYDAHARQPANIPVRLTWLDFGFFAVPVPACMAPWIVALIHFVGSPYLHLFLLMVVILGLFRVSDIVSYQASTGRCTANVQNALLIKFAALEEQIEAFDQLISNVSVVLDKKFELIRVNRDIIKQHFENTSQHVLAKRFSNLVQLLNDLTISSLKKN